MKKDLSVPKRQSKSHFYTVNVLRSVEFSFHNINLYYSIFLIYPSTGAWVFLLLVVRDHFGFVTGSIVLSVSISIIRPVLYILALLRSSEDLCLKQSVSLDSLEREMDP